MIKKLRKYSLYLLVILGLSFNLIYAFIDFFWSKLFILAFFLQVLIGIPYLMLLLDGLSRPKKNTKVFILTLIFISTSILIHVYNPEWFRSERIFEAALVDDLSFLKLVIYEDNSCMTVASSMFSIEELWGKCVLLNDKVVFIEDPYDIQSFYPDTAFIINDKLILEFDSEGNPDTSFANYFQISSIP